MADEVGMKLYVRDQTDVGFETIIKYAQSMGYDYDETFALLEEKSVEF